MALDLSISHEGKNYLCKQYSSDDEPEILDVFFFWKTAVLLAEKSDSKKPQLPETFSEPFCCLVCDLVHKIGAGYDAFRINGQGKVVATIEIKATITEGGFTDVKRDLKFDELYWLSLSDYNSLRYAIYRFTQRDLENFVKKSNTARDRGTVNLKTIVQTLKLRPIQQGRIGIIQQP